MKIALLSEKYTPDIGGLAISTERLARLLSSVEHEIRVLVPTGSLPPSDQRTHTSGGITVTRFGSHKRIDDTLVNWFELLVEEHNRAPFDLLQGYFLPQAGFVAAYAGKYLNVPSVVSIRGNDIERAAFDPSRFSHVMYALQNASAVTTNASELAKKAKAFFDREVVLIPNGIDTHHFKPMEKNLALAESLKGVISSEAKNLSQVARDSSPSAKAQSDTTPVIGFVGELREKKGLKTLLSAYAQINVVHKTTLLIVGEVRNGEDKQTFEEMRLSIPESQIIVTGYVSPSDLPAYYSLMDVFVHPSLRDGMPNAVLEAMACEIPVIATPVGGILDILEDGKNGMLVNINDDKALAEKTLKLVGDPTLRSDLGRQARKVIAEKFTPEKELDANLEIYKKLGLKV